MTCVEGAVDILLGGEGTPLLLGETLLVRAGRGAATYRPRGAATLLVTAVPGTGAEHDLLPEDT